MSKSKLIADPFVKGAFDFASLNPFSWFGNKSTAQPAAPVANDWYSQHPGYKRGPKIMEGTLGGKPMEGGITGGFSSEGTALGRMPEQESGKGSTLPPTASKPKMQVAKPTQPTPAPQPVAQSQPTPPVQPTTPPAQPQAQPVAANTHWKNKPGADIRAGANKPKPTPKVANVNSLPKYALYRLLKRL